MDTIKHRACHLCEACCGLVWTFRDGRIASVRGDDQDVFSRGHICPKGVALQDIQDDPDRIRRPLKRVSGDWIEVEWEAALEDIVERLAHIIRRDGRDAVSFYSGNPSAHNIDFVTHGSALAHLLGTRNRYSANSVDANPHLLVSLLMFGHQLLLPVPDLDRAHVLLMLGANPVVSNGSLMGVPAFRDRLRALQARGGRMIVLDPRHTETARLADEHHFIRPGTDAAFLVALLLALKQENLVAPGKLTPLLADWDALWQAIAPFEIEAAARHCGIDVPVIRRIARALAAERGVTYGRVGLSIQPFATLSIWLTMLLNIATGALDSEGGMMFGEPAFDVVATGGRAATYATFHSRVSKYPECLGELPVAALAEEIMTPGAGQIRALLSFAGNPVLSTPNGGLLDRALSTLELMVSFDIYLNETSRHAHYILPSPAPLNVDNYDLAINFAVRNVARVQRALFPLEQWEREDWATLEALRQRLAQRLQIEARPLPSPLELIDKRLKAGPRKLSLEQLMQHPHGLDLGPLRPCLQHRLRTADGRIQCAPQPLLDDLQRLQREIAAPTAESLRLIGRREIRSNNSWMHNLPRLAGGKDRCVLLVHPQDAQRRGLSDGRSAILRGAAGEIIVTIRVSADVMPGVVCMPHGWGHDKTGARLGVAARNPGASINDILDHRTTDPISGNSAPNGALVEIEPLNTTPTASRVDA